MININAFETENERFRRERAENVEREYLNYATDILGNKVTPNRVIQFLADRFNMSGEGIKTILKKRGIYKSAKQPVVMTGRYQTKQATLPFMKISTSATPTAGN